MNYHVNRNGTELGVYSPEQLLEGCRTGRFLAQDLVWQEGMPEWVTLSSLPEFASEVHVTPPPPPRANTQGPNPDPAERTGPAWEIPGAGNVFERALATVKPAMTTPKAFFGTMRLEGGLMNPFWFYGITTFLAGLISLVLEAPIDILTGMDVSEALITLIIAVVLIPILIPLAVFSGAGMTHLFLMMLGGANRPFEATFRVNCYAYGAVAPVQAIPFVGAFVSMAWGTVLEIFGLMDAHGISGGKATAAVLLPLGVLFILFCGMGIAFAASMGM